MAGLCQKSQIESTWMVSNPPTAKWLSKDKSRAGKRYGDGGRLTGAPTGAELVVDADSLPGNPSSKRS